MPGRKSVSDEPLTTSAEPDVPDNKVLDTGESVDDWKKRVAELEAKLAAVTTEKVLPVDDDDPMAMVTLQLPKDDTNYKNDLPVGVNGHVVLIQRGVPVMVPRYIAEVIKESAEQDKRTLDLVERLQKEFNAKDPALN